MIESINQMCEVWGAQKLRLQRDTNQGWPGVASIARAHDSQFDPLKGTDPLKSLTARGRDSFSIQPSQFTEEGHTGQGLEIALALKTAHEGLQTFAFVHYAVMGFDSKAKAVRLNLSRTDYWGYRDKLHYWLWGRLEGETRVRTQQLTEFVLKTIRTALNSDSSSAINSKNSHGCLNLQALHRQTLRRPA